MKLCSTPVSYFQPSRPLANSVEAGQKESRRLFFFVAISYFLERLRCWLLLL